MNLVSSICYDPSVQSCPSNVINLAYCIIDVVYLLVTGNIHGCLWSLISNFRPHQIGNAAEGKIHRMLSKLSMMWSGLFVG